MEGIGNGEHRNSQLATNLCNSFKFASACAVLGAAGRQFADDLRGLFQVAVFSLHFFACRPGTRYQVHYDHIEDYEQTLLKEAAHRLAR